MPSQKPPGSAFGAGLIAVRQARGITQMQLAKSVGTSQRMISYYEAGGGNPPVETVIAIAKALDATSDQLLGFAKPDAHNAITADDRRLWKKFQLVRQLPEKDQRAVFRLVNSLLAGRRSGTAA